MNRMSVKERLGLCLDLAKLPNKFELLSARTTRMVFFGRHLTDRGLIRPPGPGVSICAGIK